MSARAESWEYCITHSREEKKTPRPAGRGVGGSAVGRSKRLDGNAAFRGVRTLPSPAGDDRAERRYHTTTSVSARRADKILSAGESAERSEERRHGVHDEERTLPEPVLPERGVAQIADEVVVGQDEDSRSCHASDRPRGDQRSAVSESVAMAELRGKNGDAGDCHSVYQRHERDPRLRQVEPLEPPAAPLKGSVDAGAEPGEQERRRGEYVPSRSPHNPPPVGKFG